MAHATIAAPGGTGSGKTGTRKIRLTVTTLAWAGIVALAVTFVGKLFECVFAVGRGVNDVVLVLLGGEHGEAVMMARGHDDVAHARLLGE